MLIKSTKKEKPDNLKVGVFGRSGSGKTSLIKTLPCDPEHVLIIDIENGLEVLRGGDYKSIDFKDIKTDAPLKKMRMIFEYLSTPEGLNGFRWIVWDSFSMFAEKVMEHMEDNASAYDLLTKQGKFDGLKKYGDLKKHISKYMHSFLALKGLNKLCIFGAEEKADGPDSRIEVLIPGSYSDKVMFEFDEFYGLKVDKNDNGVVRNLVTNSDGAWVCKSRMSGGSESPLDIYEEANLGKVIGKCYK